MDKSEQLKIAESIKDACIRVAQEGFRDASMSGLCMEGAMEAALSAIQKLNVENVLNININEE